MILDRLEHARAYFRLGANLTTALEYLARTDFLQVSSGKHLVDGEKVFALVQRYTTKPVSQAKWEAHRNYIDVQYVHRGVECIGYLPWSADLPIASPYDPQTDLEFYATHGYWLNLMPGDFAIFGPHDVHAPTLAVAQPQAVVKVVMKVAVDPASPQTGF